MTDRLRPVRAWLLALCALILALMAVGAITRLTGSGLSIVEWAPIMGAIPPLSADDWERTFAKYREYPQYRLKNAGMTLAQFQFIFFWEYLHRLLGRLVGMAFLLPWLWFLATRRITGRLALRTGVAFVLGGMQGLLGWYMVKSGLVEKPSVSHYRLAAHLSLALIVFAYLSWLYHCLRAARLDDIHQTGPASTPLHSRLGFDSHSRLQLGAITALLALQIVYGAFTAGLKAGFGFNTFPKMGGEWVPRTFLTTEPTWLDLLENPATVQFVHRWLGIALVLLVTAHVVAGWKRLAPGDARSKLAWLGVSVWAQAALGLATLLYVVPIALATLHQLGAALLVGIVVWNWHGRVDHS